ncbi:uncharacterized protein [Misgurnus anguillicaudatus]|uniref:uncharacterized protein n=1 Tax=Misgurnus anguillicaudatus TaxID=75329 RepID=UPI003CCFBB26
MLIIFGLMLVLLQTGSCVHQICRFNQTTPCNAALGDKLSLQINRPDVIISYDTVIINSVTRADSGNYTLHLYDLQSKRIPTPGLQVNVEAPIGSVKVLVECISEQRWASCFSEGDSLFFNWTLNGQPHAQGNKTIINLDGETSGNLICSVKNHISHGEKSITVNHCPGTTPTAITTATTSSVTSDVTPVLTNNKQTSESGEVSLTFVIVWTLQMIFLLLLLGGFHIYIRKRTSTQTPEEKQQEDIVLYENWNNIRQKQI